MVPNSIAATPSDLFENRKSRSRLGSKFAWSVPHICRWILDLCRSLQCVRLVETNGGVAAAGDSRTSLPLVWGSRMDSHLLRRHTEAQEPNKHLECKSARVLAYEQIPQARLIVWGIDDSGRRGSGIPLPHSYRHSSVHPSHGSVADTEASTMGL